MEPSQLSLTNDQYENSANSNEKKIDLPALDKTIVTVAEQQFLEGGFLQNLPSEIHPLILQGLSKMDYKNMSEVSTYWNTIIKQPSVLAGIINRADFEIPVDVLIKFLEVCGEQVYRLDFHFLLSRNDQCIITLAQMGQILDLCPNLQEVVFDKLSEFYPSPDLPTFFINKFSKGPISQSIHLIGIIHQSAGLLLQNNITEQGIVQKEENLKELLILKTRCPKLQTLFISLQDPLPKDLYYEQWMHKRKGSLEFYVAKEAALSRFQKIYETILDTVNYDKILPIIGWEASLVTKDEAIAKIKFASLCNLMTNVYQRIFCFNPESILKLSDDDFEVKFKLIIHKFWKNVCDPHLQSLYCANQLRIMDLAQQLLELSDEGVERIYKADNEQLKLLYRSEKSMQEIADSLPNI